MSFLNPSCVNLLLFFFDDILVYSSSFESHLIHLNCVFKTLMEGSFFLKGSKCLFAQRQLEYLGHIVSSRGVEPDPSKIKAMVDWPTPTCIKSLHGFLGLTGFYRKFIRSYANIASPLTALLRKDCFKWSPEAQSAFEQLKHAMTLAPMLALPDFSLPFTLETDASGIAMGVVLMQKHHPIAFFSKPFCPRLQRASTYVRELHAITTAVCKWRQYLLGQSFVILMDHKSLKDLMSQVIQTTEQQVYLSKLLGYDYCIQYKAGKSNMVADALSRILDAQGAHYFILSMPNFIFLDQLCQTMLADPDFQALSNAIQNNPQANADYKLREGLIFFKEKIWIPPTCNFKHLLVEEFHNTPLGGHMGINKTLSRLQSNFYWQGMRKDVQEFVAQCNECQKNQI